MSFTSVAYLSTAAAVFHSQPPPDPREEDCAQSESVPTVDCERVLQRMLY
jgi:hypothetical protein